MSEETGLELNALDKVLLHLKDNWHHRNDKVFPVSITQKGISEATGLRLSHVPRTLKKLSQRELVEDQKAHVKGEKRRYKSYFLTRKGLEEANALVEHLKSQAISHEGKECLVGDVLEQCGSKELLPTMLTLAGEKEQAVKSNCKLVGEIPSTQGFVNRETELEKLGEMLDSEETKVMVIYGSKGYGNSTLAARFLEKNSQKWSSAWVPMHKSFTKFKKALEGTVGELLPDFRVEMESPEDAVKQLDGSKTILALDHYFEATDELVEFMSGVVSAIKDSKDFKLLITARENTPSYNRFYTVMDLHDNTVGEVHIRGLDIQHCQEILNVPDIDPDAMKRLYMFTLGKPVDIRLLAAEDVEGMKAHTRFSPEEIKLMLYLKSQRV